MADIRECAIGFLARREHSQYELKQKLLGRGFSNLAIETLLRSLAQEGLQSDERFAEIYVHHRVETGFGPRRISLELQKKGLASSLIRYYLSQDEAFWWSALSSAWQRKYHTKCKKDFGKQARFLIQRGFVPTQVYKWLKD